MHALIIEDDETVADYVARGLRETGYVVEQVADGIDGLDLGVNGSYDIAIIDVMLPRLDGLSIVREMRAHGVETPVLILSAQRSVADRVAGLRGGGDDYLIKPFALSELLARVDLLAARSQIQPLSSELSLGDLTLSLTGRQVTRAGRSIHLQPKEFALLEYLLRNNGRIVSRSMIMEKVWNYHFDPGTNVVEARISKLREKIDRDFDVPMIHTERGVGYVLRHPDSDS